ncbi:GerAB/ArcD/ProY family transporter [Kroppenstedtia pulmonis]|uniref:GerAB/ArcD/ProY family transporter n=1 Tax=Kroppenstedtia pulmonis TaxID=1380685 RepID=A0A7D4CEX0_9BACL|nr:GerAB/ArcD/ProY family transporter [Kroppenstedtia pulmonis]QKG84154.1 GerAB/ArcD/ProY family transporter [Kroppenstedtia pulmonis]
MIDKKYQITQWQLTFLILQTQIGTGVLQLPHLVQSVAKGGGWISVLIAGAVTQLVLILLWSLSRRYPSFTIYGIGPQIARRFLGNIIVFAYIVYFVLVGGSILVLSVRTLNKWLLKDTPTWVLLLLIAVTAIYLAREQLRTISQFCQLASFLIPLFVLLISYGYSDVNLNYTLPVTEAGWNNIVTGAQNSMTAFSGFELLLLAYPFTKGTNLQKLKAASLANVAVTLFYVFVTFSCLIFFSPPQLSVIPEPVLYMLKSFQIYIVDRADLIFLSIWIVNGVTSITCYIYAGANGFGYLFHQGSHKKAVLYTTLLCCLIALYPQTMTQHDALVWIKQWMEYIFLLGLPLLLLSLSYLLKQKEGQTA